MSKHKRTWDSSVNGFIREDSNPTNNKDKQEIKQDMLEATKHRAFTFDRLLKASVTCRSELIKFVKEADLYQFPKELRNCYVSLGEFISKIQLIALSLGHDSEADL